MYISLILELLGHKLYNLIVLKLISKNKNNKNNFFLCGWKRKTWVDTRRFPEYLETR